MHEGKKKKKKKKKRQKNATVPINSIRNGVRCANVLMMNPVSKTTLLSEPMNAAPAVFQRER